LKTLPTTTGDNTELLIGGTRALLWDCDEEYE